ncbi:MAG: S26 family signal peptidase, partial [Verrucomicrobiota bacterium]
ETVQIGNDRHLIINSQRLDAATPHFENVYTFTGPPRPDHYSGHLNEFTAREFGFPVPAQYFETESQKFEVRPKRFLAMGDNTLNSFDSRGWGDLPEENVIGKSAFVYWPLSKRFGWAHR